MSYADFFVHAFHLTIKVISKKFLKEDKDFRGPTV